MRWIVAGAVAAGLLAGAPAAHGNGRPPLTNGIYLQPGDAHSLYVRSTFGLLISHDDGCTMRWVCENDIGYAGSFDPKYAIGGDGTIFATTYSGLRISRDAGCSFNTATGGLPADAWIDALDIGPAGEIWVGTSTTGATNDVFASNDNGVTFTSRGMLSSTIWWKSVKVAPSNPMRVYVAGYQVAGTLADGGMMPPTGHFFRSDDDGAHWTESAMTNVVFGPMPYLLVAAVDPTNPDVLYAISPGANPPGGDQLYRSADGGTTFTSVLSTPMPISDVVIRNASTVVAATENSGSFQSTDGGATFAAMSNPPQLACLKQKADGSLVGCGANWTPDFMSVTASPDGAAWTDVWRFVQLAGPLDCPAGTAEHDICDLQQWSNLQTQFASTGPTCGAYVVDGTPPDSPPKKAGGGCCDAGDATGGLVLGALVLGLVGRRRRR